MLSGLRHGVRCVAALGAIAFLLSSVPASAQISRVSSSDHRNAVGFTLGGVFPKGEDGRVSGDVIVRDLDDLVFEVNDFNGVSVSGEWLFRLSNYLEGGVSGGGFKSRGPGGFRGFVQDKGF